MVLTEDERTRAADVFESHQRFVESVARQYSPHPQDVPDIVAAVGLAVCTSLNGYRGEGEIQAWLRRITVNAARDVFRRDRWRGGAVTVQLDRADLYSTDSQVITPDMEARLDHQRRVERLRAAVRELSAAQRDAVWGSGVRSNENVIPGSVRMAKLRAIRRLRAILVEGSE